MVDEIKRMNIKEFREEGYLQEVNRRLLHPLGLALEVILEEDGSERLGGVWDYRDDHEGIIFAESPDLWKMDNINQIKLDRLDTRMKALGFWVQGSDECPDCQPVVSESND